MGMEVEITGIGAGGAGVGRLPDGRVTFVHRSAPGDRVSVAVTEERKRWTRSELRTVLRPAPGRRTAPCPHYERCGGCTLEHLEYPVQLDSKRDLVRETLRRIGGIEIDLPPVTPSPREFRYRNRVTFTLRRTRERVVAGFHELERPDRLLDIGADCLLPEEPIAEAWRLLRTHWGHGASRLPSGEQLRLTLRALPTGEVSLLVAGGYAPGRPDALLDAIPALRSVWHRAAGSGGYRLLAGSPGTDGDEEQTGELGGDAFTQVNREAAALLESHVLEALRRAGPERVLDAYCGFAGYASALEAEGMGVVAIEAHTVAVARARRAAPRSRVLEGLVEDRLADALPVDAAVLNPPRAGLHPRVPELLVGTAPRCLVYVSCDPATLARDLGRLAPAFEVRSVRCFDLFPQTAHVETVVELARVEGAG